MTCTIQERIEQLRYANWKDLADYLDYVFKFDYRAVALRAIQRAKDAGESYETMAKWIAQDIRQELDYGYNQKKWLPGLYRIYWNSGGSSLASIYMDQTGEKWIAPVNWSNPGLLLKHMTSIKKLEPLAADS